MWNRFGEDDKAINLLVDKVTKIANLKDGDAKARDEYIEDIFGE